MTLDPNDSSNGFLYGAFGEYIFNSTQAIAGETPLGQALGAYKTLAQVDELKNRVDAVQHNSDFSAEMKLAISVLMIFNLGRGNPFVTEMPMTVSQAWHYVYDVPDEYVVNFSSKYGTKEAFWADLQSKFPDDFGLDGSSQLIQPTYLSTPPITPDWSQPIEPYNPGPLEPAVHDKVQPAMANAVTASSPLVIDLSSGHTGVTLSTWNASTTETYFDLNDNHFAVQTAWVSGDTGLLARDLDSDGVISSSAELFGSPTIDGFAKLAALDSNHDLRIDHNDSDWSTLVVWTDTNGDAITEAGELHSLSSLGIESIDLAGVAASSSTISGNPISHTSTIRFTGGATATIADAWLVHDNTNSYYVGDVTLDTDVVALPDLRGHGTLPQLALAMSQDSDLKDMVSDLAANFTLESFADADALNSAVTGILYEWAGIADVDPDSRGFNIDARHLEFVEHLLGTDYLSVANGSPSDPYPLAAQFLDQAFQAAFGMLAADLLVQVGGEALFGDTITYNPNTGTTNSEVSLSETAIADLADIAPAPGATNLAFWEAIGRFIDNTRGFPNLTVDELSWLDDAVNQTDSSLHWADVLHVIASDTPGNTVVGTTGADTLSGGAYNDNINAEAGNDVVHGNGGSDILHGGDDADTLYGDAGNDTLYGDAGNDLLYGGDGNDILSGNGGDNIMNGGAGGNILHGEYGNDSYIYSGGDDVIDDLGGTDAIYLPTGVTLSDLSITRVSSDGNVNNFWDLLIQIDGSGSIQLKNQLYAYGAPIETIVFADSSTLDLSTLTHPDAYLTAGNDGAVFAETSNFSVYGLEGNDIITCGWHSLQLQRNRIAECPRGGYFCGKPGFHYPICVSIGYTPVP